MALYSHYPLCPGHSQTAQRLSQPPGRRLSDLSHNPMAAARMTRGSFRDVIGQLGCPLLLRMQWSAQQLGGGLCQSTSGLGLG